MQYFNGDATIFEIPQHRFYNIHPSKLGLNYSPKNEVLRKGKPQSQFICTPTAWGENEDKIEAWISSQIKNQKKNQNFENQYACHQGSS